MSNKALKKSLKIMLFNGCKVEIRFEKPFKGTSYAKVTIVVLSKKQTKVATTFKTTMPFPMNIRISLLSKMLLCDMDETAANLKRVLEQ